MRTLGLDLGGTSIKLAVVDDGRVVERAQADLGADLRPAPVLARMAALAREAGAVDAAAVGLPGLYDARAGTATFLTNFPGNWRGEPVAAPLAERLGAPVALVNDVRAFTLGELELGAGRGTRDLVCLSIGTGIGGGLVVGGRLHLGLDGTAGEIGHQTVAPDGPVCGCGNRGCLEAVAAGPAIAAAGGRATPELVAEAARAGDARACKALERAGAFLGIGLANALVLLSPERVVIGGGVAAAGALLFDPIRRELARRVKVVPLERIELVESELGPAAGAIGAALWAARTAA